MKNIIKSPLISRLGDKLIDSILCRKNEFDTITVVFPSSKTEQWFKTYWLKNRSEILMNVKFLNIDEALLSFILTKEEYKLIKRQDLKSLIIKHLASKNNDIDYPLDIKDYLYNKEGEVDSIRVYDLANELSKLFFNYEEDQVEIVGWEKQIYDHVLENAIEHGFATLDYVYKNKIDFKKIDNKIIMFGFIGFNNMQEKILNDFTLLNDIDLFMLDEEVDLYKDYTVISAPSKVRELETIHSKISDLLKDKDNNYSDFLVLAPDISLYEVIIPRVFNQDNVNFPNIPYIINDKKNKETNVLLGIQKLFEIYNKDFYTRLDFFSLVNNEDIMKCRGITKEDVEAWTTAIINMNIFRDREKIDDWDYMKKRLLFSKIVSINDINQNVVDLKDGSYIPYASIDLNDESIVKFVKFVEDMKQWRNLLKRIEFINNDNLLEIKKELEKWFSIKDVNGFETNSHYRRATIAINSWYSMNVSNNIIPLNTLFYYLFDACKVMEIKSGDYFVKGITFADFDINSIIQAKYVFFLNAGAKELPLPIIKKELDIRTYDINNKSQVEKAFFIQYFNAEERFFISYLNKNLKTDEDLFPSTFVLDLESKKQPLKEDVFLDETRSWKDLYTKREYKNKDYYLGLLSSKENDDLNEKIDVSHENLKKVRVRDMADYLEEPLKYKAYHLFGRVDDTDEKIRDEYEPFELSALNEALITKKIILDLLVNKEMTLDEDYINKLLVKLELDHSLPDINDSVKIASFRALLDESENVRKVLINKYDYNFDVIKLKDLVFGVGENQWVLTCNQEIVKIVEDKQITYYQIKKLSGKKDSSIFTFIYVASLMDIASFDNNDEYKIIISRGMEYTFNMSRDKAKEILEKIYYEMNDYSNNIFNAIDLLYSKNLINLDALIERLESPQGSPWSYFNDRYMFDLETQLGLENIDFGDEYREIKNKHIELVAFLEKIPSLEEGENDEKI